MRIPMETVPCDYAGIAAVLNRYRNTDKRILIATHEWPDGDAIGTATAMYYLLNGNGWNADVFFPALLPDAYRAFLPSRIATFSVQDVNQLYDLLICVDVSGVKRIELGTVKYESITIPVIEFDHHPDNELFGVENCVDSNACAASELLSNFAIAQNWTISPDAATCLLLGIITDTGCFRFQNVTANSLEAAAKLLRLNADKKKIIQEVYFSKPLNLHKFENELLNDLKVTFNGQFAYIVITRELLDKYEVNLKETEQLIEYVRSIRGVVVAAVMKPTTSPGIFRVSLRSKDASVSVGRIARSLNGGGHEMAAGCSIFASSQEDAIDVMCRYVKRELKNGK